MKIVKVLPLIALLSMIPLSGNAVEKKTKRVSAPVEQSAKVEAKLPEKMSQDDIKAAMQNVEAMSKSLQSCQISYQTQMTMLESMTNLKIMTAEMDAGGRLSSATRQMIQYQAAEEIGVPKIVRGCIDREMEKNRELSKQFVFGFKGEEKLQTKAKEALAQWMTALSASGTPDFSSESNKFNTHANALKVELSLL